MPFIFHRHKDAPQLLKIVNPVDISVISITVAAFLFFATPAWSLSTASANDVNSEKQDEPAKVTIKTKIQATQTLIESAKLTGLLYKSAL